MHKWVDQILVPYLQENWENVVPVLLLDSYKVHKMDSMSTRLSDIGVEAYHIPGGTSVAQPVDIGVGRPFKDQLRQKWID